MACGTHRECAPRLAARLEHFSLRHFSRPSTLRAPPLPRAQGPRAGKCGERGSGVRTKSTLPMACGTHGECAPRSAARLEHFSLRHFFRRRALRAPLYGAHRGAERASVGMVKELMPTLPMAFYTIHTIHGSLDTSRPAEYDYIGGGRVRWQSTTTVHQWGHRRWASSEASSSWVRLVLGPKVRDL